MRILIAEDDAASCRRLEATLTKWAYDVVVARDGIEAWEVLRLEDAPRLAILDWMMPAMDGVEVCRKVRQQNRRPYTYLLLLTVRTQRADIVKGLAAGARREEPETGQATGREGQGRGEGHV